MFKLFECCLIKQIGKAAAVSGQLRAFDCAMMRSGELRASLRASLSVEDHNGRSITVIIANQGHNGILGGKNEASGALCAAIGRQSIAFHLICCHTTPSIRQSLCPDQLRPG